MIFMPNWLFVFFLTCIVYCIVYEFDKKKRIPAFIAALIMAIMTSIIGMAMSSDDGLMRWLGGSNFKSSEPSKAVEQLSYENTGENGTEDASGIVSPSITVDFTEICMNVGNSFEVAYSIVSDDNEEYSLQWTSSDESVITVNNGTIKALSSGKATVEITIDDSSVQSKCSFNVYVFDSSFTVTDVQQSYLPGSEDIVISFLRLEEPFGPDKDDPRYALCNIIFYVSNPNNREMVEFQVDKNFEDDEDWTKLTHPYDTPQAVNGEVIGYFNLQRGKDYSFTLKLIDVGGNVYQMTVNNIKPT